MRTFRDGDEEAVVRLFNEVYAGYGGFVPRTVEYWRWCCMERPDVEDDGVFLAFDGDRLCGYVVAGSSGNLWELCVADGERGAADAVVAEAVKYLGGVGVSSVNVNVPRGAGVVECLREAGFGEVPAERMFVTALNPAALVQALFSSGDSGLSGSDDVFGFRLRGVPFGGEAEFSVDGRGGSVRVVDGFQSEPSVLVELGFMDFLSVLFEGLSAFRLFAEGRIRVRPFWKCRAALKVLSVARVKGAWFFSLSDYG